MILGFKRLRHVPPGALVRLRDGSYAVVTEYGGSAGQLDAYLLGTGEALHTDADEWVAVIDIRVIEDNLTGEDTGYPSAEREEP